MVRTLLCCALLVSAAACTAPGPRRFALEADALLSGDALAIGELPAGPLPGPEEIFGIDAEMRAFVAAQVDGTRDPAVRLRRILQGMQQHGFFSMIYDQTETRTAQATFRALEGNCLSFTVMFVGLAREAGLDVKFQTVQLPPTWDLEADLVLVTNHINALVQTRPGESFVVDFNVAGFRADSPRRPVADEHVLALFYNNLGAEALIREEYETSFHLLRLALRTEPELADAWVNLGVLYRRLGHLGHAEAAYAHALAADPREGSALGNMANLQAALGNYDAAEEYRELVRRRQRRNPYYHYFVAREALEEQRFADALSSVQQALRLKRDEPVFRELRSELERARSASPPGASR